MSLHGAPYPPRRHRCVPWTESDLGAGLMQRCACGAARYWSPTKPPWTPRWTGRNTRQPPAPPYRRPGWAKILRRLL